MEAEQPRTAVYRVRFAGDELTESARRSLENAEIVWEGSESSPDLPSRHRTLVRSVAEEDAIAAVREVLGAHGSFEDLDALPVRDAHGEIWRGAFYRSWSEIDWQAVPRRARLRNVQRAVLGCLTDAAEPTWMVVQTADVSLDRSDAESVLVELESEGLVSSVVGEAFEPGAANRQDRWWSITDSCWDLLGFIKSPSYR